MSSVLLVPIVVDALVLAQDRAVSQAMSDFSRLPYPTEERDVHPDIANLSEEVVRAPFQSSNLAAGIHLHWALPDALTRGTQIGSTTNFPSVPNRWLVVRARGAPGTAPTVEQQWVLESDYLYPEGQVASSVTTPFVPDPALLQRQPFRYLGRTVPLEIWQEQDGEAEYLDQLTAVGYGEPTFAAFYPNCYSVFGFYDGAYTGPLPEDLFYAVLGWYNASDQDALDQVVADCLRADPALTNAALGSAVEQRLGWSTVVPEGADFPATSIYYAQIRIVAPDDSPALASPAIAVGNSGTEALSAYLAQTIDPAEKNTIEDQLEAVLMAAFLDEHYLDLGPSFQAARHEKGFNAVQGGAIWLILAQTSAGAADSANASDQIRLPEDLAHSLNALNSVQQRYDSTLSQIESQQAQLFADWYKYMLAAYPAEESRHAYPDVDLIRFFIEQKDLMPLHQMLARAGTLSLQWNSAGTVSAASAGASPLDSLAAVLAQQITAVLQSLATLNASPDAQAANTLYTLQLSGGPRYWQPNEPVVLLAGAAVEPTDRHGQDAPLACQWLDALTLHPVTPAVLNTLLSAVDQIKSTATVDQVGFYCSASPPWNPLLLEWSVEVFPLEYHSNLDPATSAYQADFITSNYALAENAADLAIRPGQVAIARSANIYTGWTSLTSRAEAQYQSQLAAYLATYPSDPTIQQASAIVNDPDFHCLTQSLGGFNQALLMRKQTYQLAIDDPLGFADYQAFTAQVAMAVAGNNRSAPQVFSDFNPLRSGAMRIQRLRLVDTFGQIMDVDTSQITRTEQLTTPGSEYLVWLPPRLAQPARINFRWLSASQGELEMSDQPATTPICGWILPNNLDGSLMIYSNAGQGLGFIDAQVRWRSMPGGPALNPADLSNDYLRQMVAYLLQRDAAFLADFIRTIDAALDAIDPENAAEHADLALFVGRPIALVRASVDLELQGLAAVQQSWSALRLDLQRNHRDTDGFTEVQFPIRIGEYQQLNDGLVGYWLETDGGYADNIFYAPQSATSGAPDPLIKTHSDAAPPLLQTLAAPALLLSMLVDPRGSIHATCGIQPVKSISIPTSHYAEALANLEVTFLTAPILTNADAIDLPLPIEAGYSWSWLEQPPSGWAETTSIGQINPKATFDAPQTLHDGWLKLKPNQE